MTVYCHHTPLHMYFIPSLLLTVTTAEFSALPTCFSACTPSATSTLNLAATFDDFTAGFGDHRKHVPHRNPLIAVLIESPVPTFWSRCVLFNLLSGASYSCLTRKSLFLCCNSASCVGGSLSVVFPFWQNSSFLTSSTCCSHWSYHTG